MPCAGDGIFRVYRSEPIVLLHKAQQGCLRKHPELVFPEIFVQSMSIQDRMNTTPQPFGDQIIPRVILL